MIKKILKKIGKNSIISQKEIASAAHEKRNAVLKLSSEIISKNTNKIIEANKEDLLLANKAGLKESYIDRLLLDSKRISTIAESLISISTLPDPLSGKITKWERPNGLVISKQPTPLGVLGIIYESRPNVTVDAAALCIKSGNSVILRCGSDSYNSCYILSELIRDALQQCNLSKDIIQLIPSKDRDAVDYMLKMSNVIDVIIPRGGKSLVEKVQKNARVPVFSHLEGICHIYVDQFAELEKSCSVVINGKMRRTGICGATETLLVNEHIAKKFLPKICSELNEKGCEIVGDEVTKSIVPYIDPAIEEDWSTEYLAPKISIKVVGDVYDAIKHIQTFGTQHTDAIMTENEEIAKVFTNAVDSAIVLVNASTQFADGGEFGLGAEIGISTGKLHARGPVGAAQLTSFKYVVHGNGQIRP
ncbi:MAG: gamma-glutamyl phosphate reductase [Alphaproteobacteria bacterium]|nr:MAG: gamma-glutamyl phosphate reductase [Alphaproteobacteria bacterium]